MSSKYFLNWSGGKDSALALYKARQQGSDADALVTAMNTATNRVLMHGVRRELLEKQAALLNLPLVTIDLEEMPGMNSYEKAVRRVHRELKKNDFRFGLFGDIFLEDLRHYRENLLAKDGLQCLFPLWKMNGPDLMKEFFSSGFKAIVICIDTSVLDKRFCGRILDESFINDLPAGVDICGENGEYHSFVFDGPLFSEPVEYSKGEIVFKEYPAPIKHDGISASQTAGFYFQDLVMP